MANTERMLALQNVREAKKAIEEARSLKGLDPEQSGLLENLYVDLDGQEDTLFKEAIDEKINDLRAAGTRLEEAAKKISKDMEKLKKVAELVEKSAKAIKLLVNIASNAGKLGLV